MSPTPVGPYTPIVRAGDWLVCSGQLGLGGGDGPPTLVAGGVGPQLTQAMANLAALLGTHGCSLADVVKTTIFLTDISEYGVCNEVYVASLGDHRPARSVVAVAGLPMGAAVEVEAWAYAPEA